MVQRLFLFKKKRVKQVGYFQLIHKEHMENIKTRQLSLFEPQMNGRAVNDMYFYEQIFRDNFKIVKAYKNEQTTFINFVHLVKFKELRSSTKEIKFVCDSLQKVIENAGYYEYFTVNQVNSPKQRLKENLSSLNGFVLDFDLMKDGTNRKYSSDELAYVIFNELNLYPHFVWETKTDGNYQSIFLINQLSGLNKYVMLFESIARRLSIVLGSDYSAAVANKLFRLPKKAINEYEKATNVYDIDDFKCLFDNEEINKRLNELQANFEEGKIVNFTEKQLLNSPAIQALINCEIVSLRNHACFTLALFLYSIGKDKQEVTDFFINDWYYKANDKTKFSKRFFKSEIRSCIKSAFSGKYAGASKEWIEGLTGHPFAFNVYRSTYISQGIYMKKNELRSRIITWVRENSNVIINQANLAEILDVKERSLKRNITELQKEGVLVVETIFEGRKRLGSMYSISEQGKFAVECDNSFNLDNLSKLDDIVKRDGLIKTS